MVKVGLGRPTVGLTYQTVASLYRIFGGARRVNSGKIRVQTRSAPAETAHRKVSNSVNLRRIEGSDLAARRAPQPRPADRGAASRTLRYRPPASSRHSAARSRERHSNEVLGPLLTGLAINSTNRSVQHQPAWRGSRARSLTSPGMAKLGFKASL